MSSLQSGQSGCDRLCLIALTREQQLRFCFLFPPPLLPPPSNLLIHRLSLLTAHLSPLRLPPLPVPSSDSSFCCHRPGFLFVCFSQPLLSFTSPTLPTAGDGAKSCCSTPLHRTPMTYHLLLLFYPPLHAHFSLLFLFAVKRSPLDVSPP